MIKIKRSHYFVDYPDALTWMEDYVNSLIQKTEEQDCLWFLEHPSIYTAGTSAKAEDISNPFNLPVYNTGRGGQFTYHGPGQHIVYIMVNLTQRGLNISDFIRCLENLIINTLKVIGVESFRSPEGVGVWVHHHGQEKKIAAIGVRIRKGFSFHGICINNTTDLSFYQGIIPCGIRHKGVTSLQELGIEISRENLDKVIEQEYQKLFPDQ